MNDLTADDITTEHVGRYVRFKRPGDVNYGRPVISGRLDSVRRWRDGGGRDLVSLTVGTIGEVDLIPRYPVTVGGVWKPTPATATRENIPLQHAPYVRIHLHGGPRDGTEHLIGGWGEEWDGKRILFRDLGDFAYYAPESIPEGVERPASEIQRKHGYGPTVFVGTVHMQYQEQESDELNARRTGAPRT